MVSIIGDSNLLFFPVAHMAYHGALATNNDLSLSFIDNHLIGGSCFYIMQRRLVTIFVKLISNTAHSNVYRFC